MSADGPGGEGAWWSGKVDAEHEDWHPAPCTWHPYEVRFADEDEPHSR